MWVDKNQRVGVVILMFRAFHFLNLYSDKVCAPFRGRRACSLLHIFFSEYQIRLISCLYISQLKCQRNVTTLNSFVNPLGVLYCEIKMQ